ncbi:hypothetical protein GXB85_04715 [Cellulomonas sp. APG4]|uniref:hypothetical protein n=1 Tax=Cellulomonas sp. APG4 TaxID=1538656 RepID=UPI00137B17D4|nr:hypothetical protein [Cellulomonas sp. APG4]NCT90256.1 hypothetical protein [Cellulomonas sp. APG4]
MSREPLYAARMAYCGPRGIPLSVFLGWAQADQDAALAWVGYEARRCSSCGYHPDEGPRHAHIDVCPGCVSREAAAQDEDAKVRGAHVHMASGTTGECDRCVTTAAANAGR